MSRPVQGKQHALNNTTLIIVICLKILSVTSLFSLQVVNHICEVPHRTRLLVVDRDTDDFLRSRGLACTEDLAIEMGTLSPRPSPRPTPSNSPLPRGNSPLSPKLNHTHVFQPPAPDSPIHMTTKDRVKRSSVTSSTATDTEVRVGTNTSDTGILAAVSQCVTLSRVCVTLFSPGVCLYLNIWVICLLDLVPKQCL